MSPLGLLALLLAFSCLGVLAHDLLRRRTAFAQFAASRTRRPRTFWLGIAGWSACLLGCLLVVTAEYGRQVCGEDECTVTLRLAAP